MSVLVTGASRGVGRAIAERVLDRGDSVLGVHRQESPASRALLGARARDGLALWRVDLDDDEAVDALLETWASQEGSLTGGVLNAGVAERRNFIDADPHDDPLRRQLRADLESPLLLLRGLLRRRLLAPGCAVVFTSSNLARRGLPGKVAYGAAKGGVESAVRGLAHELGPLGIRVNAVAPGLLRTDMTAEVGDAGYEAYAQEVPLRRVGTPADVASVVTFLLSDDAGYITGQTIDVDGGWGA